MRYQILTESGEVAAVVYAASHTFEPTPREWCWLVGDRSIKLNGAHMVTRRIIAELLSLEGKVMLSRPGWKRSYPLWSI